MKVHKKSRMSVSICHIKLPIDTIGIDPLFNKFRRNDLKANTSLKILRIQCVNIRILGLLFQGWCNKDFEH